jgi:hypothetical protein
MADKIIYAMYDDDDVLKDGAKKLVAKGIKVAEVFSPFPIHGIDPIIGIKNTQITDYKIKTNTLLLQNKKLKIENKYARIVGTAVIGVLGFLYIIK